MIFISLILFPCLRSLKNSLCDLLFVGMLLFRRVFVSFFVILENRQMHPFRFVCRMYKLVGRGPSEHVLALNFHRNQISKIPSKSINQKVFYFFIRIYLYNARQPRA